MNAAVKDLSAVHRLISDLFKQPTDKSGWDRYKLSKEQLDFFHEYGYISNVKLLDDWQVEQLNRELAEIADP
ncbi:MAG: phytanoyl-CoA dioxygenase family protein, partial [Flavitalea sp.]